MQDHSTGQRQWGPAGISQCPVPGDSLVGIFGVLVNMYEDLLAQKYLKLYLIYTASVSPLILSSLLSSKGVDGKASCAVLSGGVQGAKEERK